MSLDEREPRRSIVLSAGQNDANDSRAVGPCCGSRQRIDGRTEPVLAGTLRGYHVTTLDQQVPIHRRQEDTSRLDTILVAREHHR
jgi:hypothetical protein